MCLKPGRRPRTKTSCFPLFMFLIFKVQDLGSGLCDGLGARSVLIEIRCTAAEFIYCATLAENSFAGDVEIRFSAGNDLFATFTLKCAVHKVFLGEIRLCCLRVVAARLWECHSNKPPLIAQKMLPLRKIAPVIMIALKLSQPPVIQNRHSKFTRARHCAAFLFDSLIGQPPGESSRPRRPSQLPGWAAICRI